MTRIELATEAWEASVLPLNYTRMTNIIIIQNNNIHKDNKTNSVFRKPNLIIFDSIYVDLFTYHDQWSYQKLKTAYYK